LWNLRTAASAGHTKLSSPRKRYPPKLPLPEDSRQRKEVGTPRPPEKNMVLSQRLLNTISLGTTPYSLSKVYL
jgi:hypothetical protein